MDANTAYRACGVNDIIEILILDSVTLPEYGRRMLDRCD
jgi:hypothetical protein